VGFVWYLKQQMVNRKWAQIRQQRHSIEGHVGPLRVNRVGFAMSALRPLYSALGAQVGHRAKSEKGQGRSSLLGGCTVWPCRCQLPKAVSNYFHATLAGWLPSGSREPAWIGRSRIDE
jgi:hypothetical protein